MSHTPSGNPVLQSANALKLGVFCTNARSSLTVVPEVFHPTWERCKEAAELADAMGIEAIVPIARWKGYVDGDIGHPSHEVFDPFIYAAGISQVTRHAAIFATTHAPTIHPLWVAKQSATLDRMSGGRFALNVVGGWNRREFDMFGIELIEHDSRYDYLREWLGIVDRLWTADEEFDVHSSRFTMKAAICRPQPLQTPRIPIMNAAMSPVGMRFAAAHADLGLVSLAGEDPQGWARQVQEYKRTAREEFGRLVQVWSNSAITVRDTDAEAQEYFNYYSETMVDTAAIEGFLSTIARENKISSNSRQYQELRRITISLGAPLVGSPETIADRLALLSAAGIDGVLMTFVDIAADLRRFERDVMPLLERRGLRSSFRFPTDH